VIFLKTGVIFCLCCFNKLFSLYWFYVSILYS